MVKNGRIVDTEALDGPTNHGLLCVKGRSASFDFVHSPQRLTTPLIRSKITGELEPASWDEALDLVARRFGEIKARHGGSAIAAFACARSANEDIYMLQKMARTVLRPTTSTTVPESATDHRFAGLQRTLGSGAMTNPISDICENAQVILLVGSNPEEAHPVIGMQLRAAVARGTRLIVVDPRDIGLSKTADLHIKLKPGTNVAFANGIVRQLIHDDLIDHAFIESRTEGFADLKAMVEAYTPERVAQICAIDPRDLIAAVRALRPRGPRRDCLLLRRHRALFGHRRRDVALQHRHGDRQIRPSGCGINPLRGQNNVQGACDMGGISGRSHGLPENRSPRHR